MENISIIQILNTGVTGFAFLMLYLGYRMTSDLQNKIFEQKAESFRRIEMFREWKDLANSQLKSAKHFKIISLVFFAGGLFMMVYQYQAESEIILSVTPVVKQYTPAVHHQSEILHLNEGKTLVMVKNEHTISIANDALVNKLYELSFSLEDREKNIDTLRREKLNLSASDDVGF